RIDMDQRPASQLGLHGPLEADRLSLRHIRSHEEDAIAIGHVLLIICSRTAAERGAQTGHRGAVSYSRLVLDRHHSQPTAEQLLNEVVLLVVNRCPAQRSDAAHRVEQTALLVASCEI